MWEKGTTIIPLQVLKKNKVSGYSLTFLKATKLVNVKTKIQLY